MVRIMCVCVHYSMDTLVLDEWLVKFCVLSNIGHLFSLRSESGTLDLCVLVTAAAQL